MFPRRFGGMYVVLTVIAAFLCAASPANFTDFPKNALLMLYGSVVTPVYEELLFRGLIWNRCERRVKNENTGYFWNVLLFAV